MALAQLRQRPKANIKKIGRNAITKFKKIYVYNQKYFSTEPMMLKTIENVTSIIYIINIEKLTF